MSLNAIKYLASLAVVAFGVAACAADTDSGDESAQAGEEVGSSEADITSGSTSCKTDAYWRAHANRVCGGPAVIDWSNAVRRYRRNFDWEYCQNGAVSVPFRCN